MNDIDHAAVVVENWARETDRALLAHCQENGLGDRGTAPPVQMRDVREIVFDVCEVFRRQLTKLADDLAEYRSELP
ncbi:MAG: hypothetical protein OXB99_02730 [Acidimicrobiaceae bacterium]|nr:hypothetical protein [Acidimicrobiaceae bacterium]